MRYLFSAHGAAGKGKGYGKAAMRGGGPAKSSRVSINLNLDPPESIEIADSEEDREEKRKEERRDHSSYVVFSVCMLKLIRAQKERWEEEGFVRQ